MTQTLSANLNDSGYPNPLDKFRSYSYHYIMTAGSNTEALRALVGSSTGGVAPILGKVHDVGLGGKIDLGDSEAYLVMDTRRYSQYSIIDLNFSHFPGTGALEQPMTIIGGNGHMKIYDTTGLSFYNFLMDLYADKLKSTSSSFFLLSIIFSGNRDDGTVEHVVNCHIPIKFTKMDFEFTSAGSIFDITFIPGVEGAAPGELSTERQNYMGDISSVSTKGRDKNIGGLIDSLEGQLNDQSLAVFLKYNNIDPEQVKELKPGKLIQYMITCPPKWRAMIPNLAQQIRNSEKRFSRRGSAVLNKDTSVNDMQMTFASPMTIPEALSSILKASDEFLKEAKLATQVAGQDNVVFKISPVVTSDTTTYTIHFDIYPHSIPASAKIEQANVNFIKYDYLFTGKNSHIRDLKIHFDGYAAAANVDAKMQLGRNRLAMNAGKGQKLTATDAEATSTVKKNPDSKNFIRANDPIFVPIKTKQQRDNNASHFDEHVDQDAATDSFNNKQRYNEIIANLNFMSSTQLQVTIRGNPNIMRKLADANTVGGIPQHVSIISSADLNALLQTSSTEQSANISAAIKNGVTSAKQRYIDTFVTPRINALDKALAHNVNGDFDGLINYVDVSVLGLFAKINIRAPNVDYTGNFIGGEPLFTDSFFYNGMYKILTIDTNFSNGDFIQTLHMIPAIDVEVLK